MGEGHGPIHTTFHSKGTCSVETGDRSAQIELECGGYGTLQWNDYHPIGKPVEGTKHVLTAPTFGYFVRLHHVPGRGECTLSGYPAAEIKAAMNAVTQGASDKEARQAAQVTGSQEALVSALDRAYDEAAA